LTWVLQDGQLRVYLYSSTMMSPRKEERKEQSNEKYGKLAKGEEVE